MIHRFGRGRGALALLAVVMAVVATALPAAAVAEQASEPMSLAAGQLDAGDRVTCAVLANAGVRCWGYGGEGELGYANTSNVGDDETPGSVGPVDFGPDRVALSVAAGDDHACARLEGGSVRCWGFGRDGRLGYASTTTIGDDETPGSVGPVDLGGTAKAISAGSGHTCALLDGGSVRCWGYGGDGRLGYANRNSIGDGETPGSVGPVDLGGAVKAISAGGGHSCALLENGGSVRCWGLGSNGQLGYANTRTIGDEAGETPGSVGPVDLGGTAKAISAGAGHTCALLDDGTVRCWGYGANGRLGYANTNDIGDGETPASVGPVDLGGSAKAISAGARHTCARLVDDTVRCWGDGTNGRLGNCSHSSVGDDETPSSVRPIDLETPGASCLSTGGGPGPAPDTGGPPSGAGVPSGPSTGGAPTSPDEPDDPLSLQTQRARDLRKCLAQAARKAKRLRSAARRACLKRYGRTPGRVKGLRARPVSKTKIVLTFAAAGTDGTRPPPARAYLVKQSRSPIRDARSFARAQTLCKGSCRFTAKSVGTKLELQITDLRPSTTYYYAVVARDNVSGRLGPRSAAVKATTR